ncbi:MAG TPA: radical SAM protein [Steroidobacteraceae bacterium]|nr:radical SAM protein [Steroidobacteraceae bacterium]
MPAANRIDSLKAPLLVSWQLTRDCDLCCLHCCTESAPGKRLADELDAAEALGLAGQLIRCEVPYVMLCGGEPLLVAHFFSIAETLGRAGVQLKIETNGQLLDTAAAERLAQLPVRSIQISLDGATQGVYGRQRPGGSLAKAHAACRAVRSAGLPLEVTFAPTQLNIHEAEAVIEQASALGAFRFNTGKLMRVGTAARLWERLEPSASQYEDFRRLLERRCERERGSMEICSNPFTLAEGLRRSVEDPPATLLVLPNGWVKIAAVLPYICGDLRRDDLEHCWDAYRRSWQDAMILGGLSEAIAAETSHPRANEWQSALAAR